MSTSPYYNKIQVDVKVDNLEQQIANVADGTAGKAYPNLTTAMSITPLPEDGIIFTIDETNEAEKGVYRYDSTVTPEGYVFVRHIGAAGVIEEGNTQAVSGGEVFKTLEDVIIIPEKIDFQLFMGMWNLTGNPNSSLNWVRTGKITNDGENKYNISGVGVVGTSSTYRIPMWSGADFIGFIATDGDSFVVELPSECTEFAINVQGATDAGADIPNSPYWDSLKIFKGEYSQSKVKGESIVGDISLPQIDELSGRILDNTQAISRMNSVFINKYHAFDYGLTTGGISHVGELFLKSDIVGLH